MSVIWELYPFLLLFLLIEGTIYVKKGMIVLTGNGLLPVGQILREGIGYKADPFASVFFLADNPFIFTVDGFYYLKHELSRGLPYSGINDYGFINYYECDRITRDEKKLLLEGTLLLNAQSSTLAQAIHTMLIQLAGSSSETVVSLLRSSHSVSAVRKQLQKIRSSSSLLSFPQTALFTLFYLTPPLWYFFFRERIFPSLIYFVLLLVAWLSGVIIYALSSRKLYGKIDWLNTIQLFVFPVSICRAPSYLTSSALVGFDPFTVTALLLSRKKFTGFARKRYTLLKVSLEQKLPEKLHNSLELKKALFEEILREREVPFEHLEISPVTGDPNAVCYCPLCLAEFHKQCAVCTSCNVATKPVSPAEPKGDTIDD
jgi:hypothetical protein